MNELDLYRYFLPYLFPCHHLQHVRGAFHNTVKAEGALLNIKFRYGSLFVPDYCLIFAALEALAAMDTAEITFLSTFDIL